MIGERNINKERAVKVVEAGEQTIFLVKFCIIIVIDSLVILLDVTLLIFLFIILSKTISPIESL